MASVTKYRCDFCLREVEDTYLEPGWIKIDGSISRSWGVRKNGRTGDGQSDWLKNVEFCDVKCLALALNRYRAAKQGPGVALVVVTDSTVPAPQKKPWEDPLPEDGDKTEGDQIKWDPQQSSRP